MEILPEIVASGVGLIDGTVLFLCQVVQHSFGLYLGMFAQPEI